MSGLNVLFAWRLANSDTRDGRRGNKKQYSSSLSARIHVHTLKNSVRGILHLRCVALSISHFTSLYGNRGQQAKEYPKNANE